MIELRGVSFSYGSHEVLNDLSFSLLPGKFYGIVGPNGCGKTTLVRLLCGLLSPRDGEIFLENRPYASYSSKDLAKKLSLMAQIRTLPSVSGEELVLRGRYPYLGWSRRETQVDRNAVARALQGAGAESFAHRNVTALSGGEQQRICLAMLMAQDTPYVCLDEPTSFLDLSHRFSLMERLRVLRDDGKCIVAVLHDLSLALKYCDRLLVLSEGSLRAFGSPDEIVASGVLDEVFDLRCRCVFAEETTEYVFLPKEGSSRR